MRLSTRNSFDIVVLGIACTGAAAAPLLPGQDAGYGGIYFGACLVAFLALAVCAWLRGVVLKSQEISLFIVLSALAAYRTIEEGGAAFLLLPVSALAMIVSAKSLRERDIVSESLVPLLGIAIFWTLTLWVIGEQDPFEGRYSIVNGDPNHTAAMLLPGILVSMIFGKNRFGLSLLAFLVGASLIFLTESRSGALAFIFAGAFHFSTTVQRLLESWVCTLVVLLAIILAQTFAHYFIFELAGASTIGRETLGLLDQSNYGRMLAYEQASSLWTRSFGEFLFGVKNFAAAQSDFTLRVHHGFLELAMRGGAIQGSTWLALMAASIRHGSADFRALMVALAILGSVLSSAVFSFPLLLATSLLVMSSNRTLNG